MFFSNVMEIEITKFKQPTLKLFRMRVSLLINKVAWQLIVLICRSMTRFGAFFHVNSYQIFVYSVVSLTILYEIAL